MSEAIKTMFLMMLFAGIISIQFNMDSDRTSTRQIKNALELAVHDAALALDESRIAEGQIVFDQDQAITNFEESLKSNLNLDSLTHLIYKPKDNSFYQDTFYVEHLEFIDDSNSTFPTNYINHDYDIVDHLDGPSVIAVLSTTSPRYFAGNGIPIRKAVVYEYFH